MFQHVHTSTPVLGLTVASDADLRRQHTNVEDVAVAGSGVGLARRLDGLVGAPGACGWHEGGCRQHV